MSRRARSVIGMILFVLSLALLMWGYKPLDRETRVQPIAPNELTLPTPVSHHSAPIPAS